MESPIRTPQIVISTQTHSVQTQMNFLFNAIDDGWVVRKRGRDYIFSKPTKFVPKHNDTRYIESFIHDYIGNNYVE